MALDIERLKGRWTLIERLHTAPGSLPRPFLNASSPVCATEVDGLRCIDNRPTRLTEHSDMTVDDVLECMDFENSSTLEPMWKDADRKAQSAIARHALMNTRADSTAVWREGGPGIQERSRIARLRRFHHHRARPGNDNRT